LAGNWTGINMNIILKIVAMTTEVKVCFYGTGVMIITITINYLQVLNLNEEDWQNLQIYLVFVEQLRNMCCRPS
jgi:hypothetical protein